MDEKTGLGSNCPVNELAEFAKRMVDGRHGPSEKKAECMTAQCDPASADFVFSIIYGIRGNGKRKFTPNYACRAEYAWARAHG
jgi:hypothetical protein